MTAAQWIITNIPTRLMDSFALFLYKQNDNFSLDGRYVYSFLADNLSAFLNTAESVVDTE